MLIDWFTVGAQALNFIVLVWLMKRFLYQPVLNAIDAREKVIADKLARAEKISEDARTAKASFEQKNLEFDRRREQLMAEATEEANAERQRLKEEADRAAEQLATQRQQALRKKMQDLHEAIRSATQKELFAMARNALRDLAAVDIQAQMVAVFLQRLREQDREEKHRIQTALAGQEICVRSNSNLSLDQQSLIENTVHELFGDDIRIRFEQSADLIGGIELNANGFKVGWSIAEYLHALEETLSQQISTDAGGPVSEGPKSLNVTA
jgi:F-type H+-transporting ATPase subunit b